MTNTEELQQAWIEEMDSYGFGEYNDFGFEQCNRTVNELEIYEDQITASNWTVGCILEDVRHDSPYLGCQFKIVDYDNGTVRLRRLNDHEYVVASEIFARIR